VLVSLLILCLLLVCLYLLPVSGAPLVSWALRIFWAWMLVLSIPPPIVANCTSKLENLVSIFFGRQKFKSDINARGNKGKDETLLNKNPSLILVLKTIPSRQARYFHRQSPDLTLVLEIIDVVI
jgi:hypothetical protein